MMELRVKPLGLVLIVILIGAGVLGALRWQSSRSTGRSGAAADAPEARGEVVLVTSPTKKDWLQSQVDIFNARNKGKMSVKVEFFETRDALQAILNGKTRPALWAPSNTFWVARLGESWSQAHPGAAKPLLDTSDPSSFRVYLRTPLVFVTTPEKARALHPLFASGSPWAVIHDLSAGSKPAPYPGFKFSYADPVNSNSGFMTLGAILADYAARTGQSGDLTKTANSPEFAAYLAQMNRKLVYDAAAREGSSPLFKAFTADKSRYDLITTYESNALGAALKDLDIAVIYPNPTVVAEQGVVLLIGADWLTPEQRAIGREFLTFLATTGSLSNGVASHFRPAQPTNTVTLAPELNKLEKQGFQQSFTSVELPPYNATNDAAVQWRRVTGGAVDSPPPPSPH